MIQVFSFLHRLDGTSPEEFDAYWRDHHAPLVAGTAEVARYLRGYEQNPRLASDRARASESWDGVAVLAFDDLEGLRAFSTDRAYTDLIAPDEARFLERERVEVVITRPPRVIVDAREARRSAPIRMLTRLRRRAGLSAADFDRHWGETHAPIVCQAMGENLAGYEQNVGLPGAGPDGGTDGVASVWYESMEHFGRAIGGGSYRDEIAPDEERFLDRSDIQFVFTAPARVVIEPKPV